MEYRIDVVNKFSAIQTDDDVGDDPYETINKLQEQLALAKKSAQKAAPVKKQGSSNVALKNEKNAPQKIDPTKPTTSTTKSAAQVNQTNVTKSAPSRLPKSEANTESEFKTAPQTWSNDTRPREDRTIRGGRGGPRRGRGARRGPEGEFAGKREFDRHSGNDKSGVKPQEKREGGGAHNWGSVKDDINGQIDEAAGAQDVSSSQENLTKNDKGKENESNEATEEKVTEPEEKQMTLDEWKKLEGQNRMRASFNIRKANEGFNDPKWSKMVALKKKGSDDEQEEEEEIEEEVDEKAKQKNKLQIQITFNDVRRGRGRGMSRRGFNPERKPAKAVIAVPNVADEIDFPSLS